MSAEAEVLARLLRRIDRMWTRYEESGEERWMAAAIEADRLYLRLRDEVVVSDGVRKRHTHLWRMVDQVGNAREWTCDACSAYKTTTEGGVRGDARKRTSEQSDVAAESSVERCARLHLLDHGAFMACDECEDAADLAELEAAADAAYEHFAAVATYYSAASDAHVSASSALAAALIEHQEKP